MIKKIQAIANDILELTNYRVYTPEEINSFYADDEDFDPYEEDDSLLILCCKLEEESYKMHEIENDHLHPGFLIRVPKTGDLEAWSIIPPGPQYRAVDIDGIIDSIMEYYNEL